MSKLRQKIVNTAIEKTAVDVVGADGNSVILDVPKRKSEISALTLYVVFSISMVIIYSVVEMIVATKYEVSHDTLTTCFYSVFGGEILCCALIKIFKLKSNDSTETESSVTSSFNEPNSREG